jgi:hypothetical protein
MARWVNLPSEKEGMTTATLRRVKVSIGTFKTKAEAEVSFAVVLADQQRGAWVAPDDGKITLGEYASRWLACRLTSRGEPLRPRVQELYEATCDFTSCRALGRSRWAA